MLLRYRDFSFYNLKWILNSIAMDDVNVTLNGYIHGFRRNKNKEFSFKGVINGKWYGKLFMLNGTARYIRR